MRNNIERTPLGSYNPFDLIDQQEQVAEDLDNVIIEGSGFEDEEEDVQKKGGDLEHIDEGQEYDSEDDEEEEEQSQEEIEIQANITKVMAKRMKEEGQLPEDFEITDDISPDDVELAYRKFIEEKAKSEIEADVLSNIRSTYGGDEILETAKRIHFGVSEEEIDTLQAYNILSNVDFNEEDDNYEKAVKYFFTQYYLDKQLPEDEAEANAERDFEDFDVEELVKKRKSYFNSKAIDLDQQQRSFIREKEEEERRKVEESRQKINGYLDKGVIDGMTYSKQDMDAVRKALFEKTEILEINGKRHRVTPYYKKRYLRAQNPEQSLKDMVDFILGYDLKTVVKKAAKSSKRSLIDDLNETVKVSIKRTLPPSRTGDIQRRSLD